MTGGLLLSAALMGLAGNLHCAAMCAPGCGALSRGCVPAAPAQGLAALTGGRVLGYAAAGLEVTALGWYFVRTVAMVFDRHLQADRTRERFSKVI